MKRLAWHLEMALLRRRMRSTLDVAGSPSAEVDTSNSGLSDHLSELMPLRETTWFADLH